VLRLLWTWRISVEACWLGVPECALPTVSRVATLSIIEARRSPVHERHTALAVSVAVAGRGEGLGASRGEGGSLGTLCGELMGVLSGWECPKVVSGRSHAVQAARGGRNRDGSLGDLTVCAGARTGV